MKKTETSIDIGTIPLSIREYLAKAAIYDSSCSENAKTYFIKGEVEAYLKISKSGSLGREKQMTQFLNGYNFAPKVIAYVSENENDYLLTESLAGEDGTAAIHLENPQKLAHVFGENLRQLHSLPIDGCPFIDRITEIIDEAHNSHRVDQKELINLRHTAIDDVIIHGDYCLPNIIMDNFLFKGFIDLGYGGVGDRHYDIYWGLWTLNYNLKTSQYNDLFLDAYSRSDIDEDRLNKFSRFIQSTQ